MLGVALSLIPALAQTDLQQDPAAAPGFSRVKISLRAAVRFEGTGVPGDRIALHVDGQQAATARVDAQGQWRIELEEPLPPGGYTARVLSIGQGNSASRVSGDVRIVIPDADLPVYASSEKDENDDVGPPDAATLRRASELARDASRMFSKVIEEEQATASQDQQAGRPDVSGDEAERQARDALPVWPVDSVAAWLSRARHDYNEVLVKGLSDPARWRQDSGSLLAESPPPSGSTVTAWPESDVAPTAGYLSVAAGWLQRSSRDYHDFLVRELILRGIEDEQQRELARAAMSGTTIAVATETDTAREMPGTRAGPSVQTEEQRLAEARQLEEGRADAGRREAEESARHREVEQAKAVAEAQARAQAEAEEQRLAGIRRQEQEREDERAREEEQRLAEARQLEEERADAERREAEERARQRDAEEQRQAEIRRQEQDRKEARAREEQRLAETRQALSLDEYLAARPQDTRPHASEAPKLKRQAGEDRVRAWGSTEGLTDMPLPDRIDAGMRAGGMAVRVPTRVDVPTRERLMAAMAAERAGEEARPALRRPRVAARAASRQARRTTRAGRRKPSTVRKSRRKHHARARSHRKHARNRVCRQRRAGRAIRLPGTYVIAYGDTLWSIAERHYGAGHRYRRIRHADGGRIARPHRIYPCQRVWLPRPKHRRR